MKQGLVIKQEHCDIFLKVEEKAAAFFSPKHWLWQGRSEMVDGRNLAAISQ